MGEALSAFNSPRSKFLTTKAGYENKYAKYKDSQNNEDAVYYMGKCQKALDANDKAKTELEAAAIKLATLLEQLEYVTVEVRDKVFAVHPEYAPIFHKKYDVDTEQ